MKRTFRIQNWNLRGILVVACWLLAAVTRAQSYSEMVKQGLEALEIDSLTQAEDLFRSALRKEPALKSNAILYQYLGQIQERKALWEEALQNYSIGIGISPTTMGLLLCRASLYMRLGNEKRALTDYSSVLDLNPDHPEALFFRAHLYRKGRMFRESRADYERLIRLEPDNEHARLGLVLLNDEDARPREAMEQIDALLSLHPRHASLYAVKAGMEQKRKLYEQALLDINKAIELEPLRSDFFLNRASLYLDMGKKKLAKADCQQALRLGAEGHEVAELMRRSVR